MNTVDLEITTRTGCLYHGDITKVTCPTTLGYITVLPHHVALVSVLAPGTITVHEKTGTTQTFDATSGIIEIRPTSITIMLHETAALQ